MPQNPVPGDNSMQRLSWSFLALALVPVGVGAQPTPPPDSGDALCEEGPTQVVEPDLSHPDPQGFYSLFNGTDLKGWWLNCITGHTAGAPEPGGPIFRVDTVRKALYSNRRTYGGGVLMTRAKFMDYELEFD